MWPGVSRRKEMKMLYGKHGLVSRRCKKPEGISRAGFRVGWRNLNKYHKVMKINAFIQFSFGACT